MKAILSNKTIIYILTISALPYLMAGFISAARADNSSAFKDAIGYNYKVAELKTGEIKAAESKVTEAKPADAMTKAHTDEDFKKLDANGDGKISLKEAVKDKALAAQFDATDVNHDGMIATDEFASYKMAASAKGAEPSAVTPVTN